MTCSSIEHIFGPLWLAIAQIFLRVEDCDEVSKLKEP